MEGDFHVGQVPDTLKELGIEENTIVVFASDVGSSGVFISPTSTPQASDRSESQASSLPALQWRATLDFST